jgi:hypothetical protein
MHSTTQYENLIGARRDGWRGHELKVLVPSDLPIDIGAPTHINMPLNPDCKVLMEDSFSYFHDHAEKSGLHRVKICRWIPPEALVA